MGESTIILSEVVPEHVNVRRTEDLEEYERIHGVHVNYRKFVFLLNDRNNNSIGVLEGYTAYAEIYIDDLWIDSKHRNCGYGSLLVEELENTFRDEGFNNINLVTSAFQAPGFYRKCGFVEEFTRINFQNPKLNKTFFVKFFQNADQTQGVLAATSDT